MAFQPFDPLLQLLTKIDDQESNHDLIKVSKVNQLCRVCGGPGRCMNYGAITCQACRAFFRRHGPPSKIVQACPWNGACQVNVHRQIRPPCIKCRLARCFAVGMSAEYMRKRGHTTYSPMTSNAPESVLSSPEKSPPPQLPTLDLLQNDRSTLTSTQWTLLSNITHAYDAFSTIPYARSVTEQLSRLSLNQNYDGSVALDIIRRSVTSIRSFIHSIPDFQILTTGEQRSLLDRNWYSIGGFNFLFVLRDSALADSPQFTSDGLISYSKDVIERGYRIKDQLEMDSTLIKMMVVVLAFSSNCLVMDVPKSLQDDQLTLGTFRLLGSQNVFVELLWKYMLYRYGYQETVLRFAHLVKQMLNTINYVTQTYMDNKNHQYFMDKIFAEDRFIFAASRNVRIPLWGNVQP